MLILRQLRLKSDIFLHNSQSKTPKTLILRQLRELYAEAPFPIYETRARGAHASRDAYARSIQQKSMRPTQKCVESF